MTAKEALTRYEKQVGSAKAPQHLAVVTQYLNWGGDGTVRQFGAYLKWLQTEKHYKSGTIAYHQRILRAFLHTAGITMPIIWQHQETEDRRVAFSADWIRQAIQVAKSGQVDPVDAWILCTCTVYGVRSTEVAQFRAADADFVHHRLFIHTAKDGVARWQWMPPAVERRWADGFAEVTLKRVHQALKNIAAVGDLPLEKGADIHAIRRGLVVAFDQAGIGDTDIGRFLRWKLNGSRGAAAYREKQRYSHPTTVIGTGRTVPLTELMPGSRDEDAAVWDRHPFVGAWE